MAHVKELGTRWHAAAWRDEDNDNVGSKWDDDEVRRNKSAALVFYRFVGPAFHLIVSVLPRVFQRRVSCRNP